MFRALTHTNTHTHTLIVICECTNTYVSTHTKECTLYIVVHTQHDRSHAHLDRHVECKWHVRAHTLFAQTLSIRLAPLSFSNTRTQRDTHTYRDVRHFIFTPALSVPRLTTSSTGQPAPVGPAWTTLTLPDQIVCAVTFVHICVHICVHIYKLSLWGVTRGLTGEESREEKKTCSKKCDLSGRVHWVLPLRVFEKWTHVTHRHM